MDRIRNSPHLWVFGLAVTVLVIAIPIALFVPRQVAQADDPWTFVPQDRPHTDHASLLTGPYDSGPAVTRACLECHAEAGHEMLSSVHWTWQSEPVQIADRSEPVAVGKKNLLNNFCIGIQSNWTGCTTCHAGYGWDSAGFDFSNQENMDCLACHADRTLYGKTKSGLPADGIDLAAAAQSVSWPTRQNCGSCHFDGGGGNGVKHGDMDDHLYFPSADLDVHMGGLDFQCTDCHQAENHQISGRSITSSADLENQIACTDCHAENLHTDQRLNAHVQSVACQTCHIPSYATGDPTKMSWDWSTAGQDRAEDPHEYLKIKGSFVYEEDVVPTYAWYSGLSNRYLLGDPIDPQSITVLNPISGDIHDQQAKIMPFKIHLAKQPYDAVYNYLLQPKTVGEYWVNFDWDKALRAGSEAVGLEYSGQYGFAETMMYWPITHLVTAKENALQCSACHSENGRLDWEALGYPGDPLEWGGRFPNLP